MTFTAQDCNHSIGRCCKTESPLHRDKGLAFGLRALALSEPADLIKKKGLAFALFEDYRRPGGNWHICAHGLGLVHSLCTRGSLWSMGTVCYNFRHLTIVDTVCML